MTHKISYLAGIFTSREASATIAIHWNIISNGHFPFFIANTSAFTYAYVVVFRFWTENESLFRVKVYESWILYPCTWSGAPHLANGLCPFGITANLMWRPRHWAVWIDPGTNTWLLFRQNARQNVFNWVLCSHFSQFQTDKVHIRPKSLFAAQIHHCCLTKCLKTVLDTNSVSINGPLFKHFWTKRFVCCHWFQFWWWLSLCKFISAISFENGIFVSQQFQNFKEQEINSACGGVSSNSMSPSVCGGAFMTVGADVGFGLKSCHALYLFKIGSSAFEKDFSTKSNFHFWTSPEVKCIHLRTSSSSIHFSFELTSESNHWEVVSYSEVFISQGLAENMRKSHFLNGLYCFNIILWNRN